MLAAGEHAKNNLPEVLGKWRKQTGESRKDCSAFADRTAQCFSVPKDDIAAQGYDLSLNRYKEVASPAIKPISADSMAKSSLEFRFIPHKVFRKFLQARHQ